MVDNLSGFATRWIDRSDGWKGGAYNNVDFGAKQSAKATGSVPRDIYDQGVTAKRL